MKKILFTILGLTIYGANAYTTINLNSANYSCNGVKITSDTTESIVASNCKNYKVKYTQDVVGGDDGAGSHNLQPTIPVVQTMTDDDINNLARVRFITDQGQKMECFYRNSKLYKCKISNAPPSESGNIVAH